MTLDPNLNNRSESLFNLQAEDASRAGAESSLFRSSVRAQDLLEGRERDISQFGGVNNEVDRLRAIARPREEALRASTISQLANRGRLAVTTGGGLTGGFSNPELASLEEGLARADLARVGAARQEEQRLLNNFANAINLNLGVNAQAANLAGNAFNLRTGAVNNSLIPLAQLGAGQAFGGFTSGARTDAAADAALGNQIGGIFSGLGNSGALSGLFGGGGGGGGFDFLGSGGGTDTAALAGTADTFDFSFGGA